MKRKLTVKVKQDDNLHEESKVGWSKPTAGLEAVAGNTNAKKEESTTTTKGEGKKEEGSIVDTLSGILDSIKESPKIVTYTVIGVAVAASAALIFYKYRSSN